MKKILKILGTVLLLLLVLALVLPLFLEGRVENLIKTQVNQNLNATFNFEDASLSLIRHFPYATVALEHTTLINKAPFEGDTLFYAGKIDLTMSVAELFKSAGAPMVLKSLSIDRAQLDIKIDEAENANYDISIKKDGQESATAKEAPSNLRLALESYAITNTQIRYTDRAGGIQLGLFNVRHSGSGDLSLEKAELQTHTKALISLTVDSTNYLNRHHLSWDARIGIDLKENRYTLLENKALVNQLPLVFEGFVQVNEENQEVDLTFSTPSSDFRNFLAVIPEAYSKDLEKVQTTGNFKVNGRIKGISDKEHIPPFHISLKAENASFTYPNLPKSIQNIFLNAEINNTTGFAKETSIAVNKLSFTLDGDTFNLNAHITELLGNPKIKSHINGILNLDHLSQAYPLPSNLNLKGLVKADITTAFDKESISKKQYQKTNTQGNVTVTGFQYRATELPHLVVVDSAALTFTPQSVSLRALKGKTGNTDFKVTGTINNLLGFLLNDEKVKGDFILNSKTIDLQDFMAKEEQPKTGKNQTTSSEAGEENIKIPAFLDCTLKTTAHTVLYDNLSLNSVKGTLNISDEKARLENVTAQLLGGTLALTAAVSTQEDIPTFTADLGMRRFNIQESFAALDLFKVLAPIARALEGRFNSDISLSGNLKDTFVPNLATISGSLAAQLLSTEIDVDDAPLTAALEQQLDFLNPEGWKLENLSAALRFNNGRATVQPFTLTYKDIAIQVEGSHSFDQQLSYTARLNVPASYLGKEITTLLSRVNDKSLEKVTLPVTVNIQGTYTNPTVRTDITSGIKALTTRLVNLQTEKLMTQGKTQATRLLSGVLQKNATDSTLKETLERGSEHKNEDSLTTKTKEEPIKRAAKSILEGLLGNTKKDSVK